MTEAAKTSLPVPLNLAEALQTIVNHGFCVVVRFDQDKKEWLVHAYDLMFDKTLGRQGSSHKRWSNDLLEAALSVVECVDW